MIIKKTSIKVNYLYNVIRLVLNLGIVALSMPYASRVLGSAGIGKVEYAFAIIEYFFLFSALGIPIYGIRIIAQHRDDVIQRSLVVAELLSILIITTILAYTGIFIYLGLSGAAVDFKQLVLFLSSGILLSNFGLEWFYQGIEDQKYITIRHIFVKVIALILLFTLVNNQADVYYYALFIIVSTLGGNIANFFHLKKFVVINKTVLKSINIKRHLKPVLTIFISSVSVSFYILLDKVMLGAMVSETAVGYYAQAIKLPKQAIFVVTTVGAVMLPRLSHLLHHGKREEYTSYVEKSLRFILLMAVPVTLFFTILAKEIILVMAGEDFLPSVTALQITAPSILIVAYAYYVGFQVLYPAGREKLYTIAVSIAAVVNVIFNLLTIKFLKQDGVAIGTLIAEIIGLLIMILFSRKMLSEIGFFKKDKLSYFVGGAVMCIIMKLVTLIDQPVFVTLCLAGVAGFISYIAVLFLIKEKAVADITGIAKAFLRQKGE